MPARIADLRAWFTTRHEVDAASGCWNWTGATYPNGYGNTKIPGTRKFCMAHRLAYRIFRGEVSDSLVLDHLCGNRACVNPDHLEPVTQGENLRRAGSIARVVALAKTRGATPACAKGHPLSGDNLYTYPNNPTHRGCQTCMREYRKRYHQARKTKRTA
jgi:hypothetical protein